MASFITPLKLGLKFNPPCILLVYREKGKLRKRQIPAKNLDMLTDLRLYVEKFKADQKYRKYFEKISNNKLEKILFILQDNMKGYSLKESVDRAKKYDNSKNNTSLNDDTDVPTESVNNKSEKSEKKSLNMTTTMMMIFMILKMRMKKKTKIKIRQVCPL